MAIYHLEAKVISRGAGRSACAAAAYMSCSQILNDYDGIKHDYTRKQGLVWQQVFLPKYAPQEWLDRAVLWNAVEENEKTKDSRLAREFVVALPVELDKSEWQKLLSDFIQEQFVSDGMCADVAIHDTDGHNPHAHIMLTVRPLDEQGKWQYKTEKEYLCVRNSEERGFTAAEFKTAQTDGWEKLYQYKVGKKKVYLPPSEAEAHGYERVSKYPKSTKYGRQNPITERWNSDEQLVLWRKAWADVTNLYLERNHSAKRIDHRSHAERGLDEQPTIHEGVVARALEKKGIISDRCEINRQIKADNALLRELKATVKKLTDAIRQSVPSLAEAMERLRMSMIIFRYQVKYAAKGKADFEERINAMKPLLEKHKKLSQAIKEKMAKRKALTAEKNALPAFNIIRRQELSGKIAGLTEDIEELRSERTQIMQEHSCYTDEDLKEIKKNYTEMKEHKTRLEEHEQKYSEKLNEAAEQFQKLSEQAAEVDAAELHAARLALRTDMEHTAHTKLSETYGGKFDSTIYAESRRDVNELLGENITDNRTIKERLQDKHPQQDQQNPKRNKRTHDNSL